MVSVRRRISSICSARACSLLTLYNPHLRAGQLHCLAERQRAPGGEASFSALILTAFFGSFSLWICGSIAATYGAMRLDKRAVLWSAAAGLIAVFLVIRAGSVSGGAVLLFKEVALALTSLSPQKSIALATASLLLCATLLPAYVRQFDPAARDLLRVRITSKPKRQMIVRHAPEKHLSMRDFRIGALLTWRTMAGRIVLGIVFSALIGAISTVYMETEGRATATLFAASLLAFILMDTARRARVDVGGQHLFLLLHRPGPPANLWRALVAGSATTLALMALSCYASIVAFYLNPNTAPRLAVAAAPVVEFSVWLAALAHLLGPNFTNDRWLRAMAFWIGGVALLLMVGLKTLLMFRLPILLVLQSLLFAGLAVLLGGRQPWGITKRANFQAKNYVS